MTEEEQQSLARTIGRPALEDIPGGRGIERLPGAHLKIKLEQPVFLRLACVNQRHETRIIGLEPFSFFIVPLRLPTDTLARLAQNPNATAQLNAGEALYGFRTEVISRVSTPEPLLFLSFPETVERVGLRRGRRVGISLPARLHGPFGEHEVMLLDIAPEGCRFTARAPLKSPLREARPGDRVALTCTLGDSCSLPLVAAVVLRRVDEARGRVIMGGQFADLDEDNAARLNAYITRLNLLLDE